MTPKTKTELEVESRSYGWVLALLEASWLTRGEIAAQVRAEKEWADSAAKQFRRATIGETVARLRSKGAL